MGRLLRDVRRKPLGHLDAEDYRVLLLQLVGVEVLVSRALTQLERDPLWEGDFYPGVVLSAGRCIGDAAGLLEFVGDDLGCGLGFRRSQRRRGGCLGEVLRGSEFSGQLLGGFSMLRAVG